MPTLQEKLQQQKQNKGKSKGVGSALRKKLGIQSFEDTVAYKDNGTLEEDVKAETDAIETGFKARAKAESERFEQATDTRFYCVLVFQTEAQKQAYLQAIGCQEDFFIDGLRLAEKQGIKLDKVKLRNKEAVDKLDKKLAPLVMD